MTNGPVIIAQLRWIALIVGLFGLYLCSTVPLQSTQQTPSEAAAGSDAMAEFALDAGQNLATSLLDEVPDSIEFVSLDMMLAGRSTGHHPVAVQETKRVKRPPFPDRSMEGDSLPARNGSSHIDLRF